MRAPRATALFSGLLALPAAAAAQATTAPDLSSFPVQEPRILTVEELRPDLERAAAAMGAPKALRLDTPANVRVVDEVALVEVQSCETEPETMDATCGVYHAYDFDNGGQSIPFYDYSGSLTILGPQLVEAFGDDINTFLLFNQYPTMDFGGGFYLPIYSENSGIGTGRHDLRPYFGASENGALRGIVSMNMWWSCDWGHWFQEGCTDEAPFATTFRSLHGVIGQEVGHEWGVFLRYLNENNRGSVEWLGRDRSHWSYWVNSGGSPLEGNRWEDNGQVANAEEGIHSFDLVHTPYTKFSDFDLYAMGVMAKEEVQPTFFIRPSNCTGSNCDEATPPESGPKKINGKRVDVTIDDVIATMGERSPSFEEAPRFTRQLFVFTRLDTETDDATTDFALEKMGRIRRFWNEYFYEATRTRMRAITTLSGRDDYPRFEFTIGDEGWSAAGATGAAVAEGGLLEVTADGSGAVGITHGNVQIAADEYQSVFLRVALPASAQGKAVRLVFGGLDGVLDQANAVEILPMADGSARGYGADLSNNPGWTGTIGTLRVELVDAAEGESLGVDRLAFRAEAYVDQDDDQIVDGEDNCAREPNEDQADADGDGVGDACDDDDGDGRVNTADNCPTVSNRDQADADGDGVGDLCEDGDGDGVYDVADNCPAVANTDQADGDADGVGDLCESASGGGGGGKKKSSDGGGCSSSAALPSAAGLLLAGLAVIRRRR